MTVAVLALQGAFIEHEHVLEELGVKTVELRQAADLDQPYDGLILPGGESTVQGKLLRELKMFDPLKKQIADGLPVLGTCAGLILLGSPEHFGTIPMQVKRNAYGRQLGSFHTTANANGIGEISEAEFKDLGLVPMSFIRAPYVESVSDGVEVLSVVDDHIVGVRYGNQVAIAFHPELDRDRKIHQMFLDMIG